MSSNSCEPKILVNDVDDFNLQAPLAAFSHIPVFISKLKRLRFVYKNLCVLAALNQQCLELLSMLNVKEQRDYQGTKPQYSPERDASVLEVRSRGSEREREG